jgi:hypothetical protein
MECKKLKKEKENESDCEKCRKKDLALCMFFIVFGFLLTAMGSCIYVTTYEKMVSPATPSLSYSLSVLTSSNTFSMVMVMLGGAMFSLGLFYLILNARKYEGIEL